MPKNYRRGYRAELEAKKRLEAEGFAVIRAAGSKSPFDLVALDGEVVRFVQVKRVKSGNGGLAKVLRELEVVSVPPCARKEIWLWRDREGFVERRVAR
ncbi:Holliday junction resolvase [Thermodesulfitimonas autotrophica]|uniref:Holliday junction resolvase n=1 Tax=Thermodesulfitimonas autotrophica TaxID=1894989 RepID=A0A3N5ADE7_9THEO|nr:hypothetical protein [Thermodesulfitimonas autotrophica]RPF42010.1 Holliday junction resolvase [Thermodesulfitimonas autotrophica]